jgi:hypothetical protein
VSLVRGATGERVEQDVVHVCRKMIDCTRLALLGALSPRSERILGLLCMPGTISPTRTPSACVGYYSERGGYLSPRVTHFSLHLGQCVGRF